MVLPIAPSESITTIHAALDAGITLLDTDDFYGMGHNELLLHETPLDGDGKMPSLPGALCSPDGSFIGFDGQSSCSSEDKRGPRVLPLKHLALRIRGEGEQENNICY